LRLNHYGDCVQLSICPDYAPYVERLLQPIQQQSLSQAAMETLSIIAYRQPVTKSDIEKVRGVKCDYSVQSLVGKGLIEEVGRRETLGRPILYATTDAFLRHFGIETLDQLPEQPGDMGALEQMGV
ncbi:MAG: SMC-Scp complex subunit ScpB, partial [Clostridia bacterium]